MSSDHVSTAAARIRFGIAALLAMGLLLPATTVVAVQDASDAEDTQGQAFSRAALQSLADVVEDYIERDLAVGAELVVIKDRDVVLHEAFGWRDREGEVPMDRNTIFNIRSMTKPITGAAIQILIDEGKLALDDRASEYLSGFDNDAARDITIEQLLTHTAGLPLTIVASTDQFDSLLAMADAVGEGGPEFEPGSKFWYSDSGTDALGAIAEQVSGASLEEFVTARLLEPLGMDDTLYLANPRDDVLDRVASLYFGRVGDWNRIWSPADEPFYPHAWGSQSLYGTPLDYARFLAMWLDDGIAGETRVLSPEAVARTLTPTEAMSGLGTDAPYPTRFSDATVGHGQLAVLHVPDDPAEDGLTGLEPSIVGYSGSDGTIAWAWPEDDLIILYFTQSRGGSTAIRLEAEIERLLLDPSDDADAEMPAEYAEYLGVYTANFGPVRNEPFEILWRDGGLALDIPSEFIVTLDRVGTDDRWTLRDNPSAAVTFDRNGEGEVTALLLETGGQTIAIPKGVVEEAGVLLEDVERYLGSYREQESGTEVELVYDDGSFAMQVTGMNVPLSLFADDDGAWRLRLDPTTALIFNEQEGVVDSFIARSPLGEESFVRSDQQSDSNAAEE